jgi:hypothetical protein
MRRIHFTELPPEAMNKISKRQNSYIDEFIFYEYDTSRGKAYACYYAGEFLCVWQNQGWQSILPDEEVN